jgi:hypothetical protein
MKRILLLPVIFTFFCVLCLGQKSSIPIVGCYTDIVPIKEESLIVGSGYLIIKKVHNRYVANFSELANDGGKTYPTMTITKLIINEPKRKMAFDLPLHSGTTSLKVTGQIYRNGIKMRWNKNIVVGIGQNSPFMRRKRCSQDWK